MSKNHSRNVLVTGGVQGIGRSIVETLQQRGDQLFVFDCVVADDTRVQELTNNGVTYHRVDIASVSAIQQAFVQLPEQLHVLVNNAGIARDNLAVRLQEADWDSVLEVNLKGAFFCAQQAIKKMMRQQPLPESITRGYIINIASVVAHVGNPGQVNYVASKAGLIGVTKTLAREYAGRNVLVNAVAPGFIQTDMIETLPKEYLDNIIDSIPMVRLGMPDDVSRAVMFLASDDASYITGQVLSIDGGLYM